jgi:hypothetical protein
LLKDRIPKSLFRTQIGVRTALLWLFVAVATFSVAQEQTAATRADITIRYDEIKGRARRVGTIVPASLMERRGLQSISEAILSTAPSALTEVLFASSESDLARSIRTTTPRAESEANFSDTLSQLSSAGGSVFSSPIARVLTVSGSTLLSIRDAGRGQASAAGLHEWQLTGIRNPTVFKVGGEEYRLLTFALPYYQIQSGFPLVVFFESVTAKPSCAACQELARELSRASGASNIRAEIRPDVWFASKDFPLVFRFEPDNRESVYHDALGFVVSPKIDQYYRRDHVFCNLASIPRDHFQCDGYGRYEHVP